MGAVPSPSHPIDAFYRCYYHIRGFAGSEKCLPEKQTTSHWTVETLCMDSSCVHL